MKPEYLINHVVMQKVRALAKARISCVTTSPNLLRHQKLVDKNVRNRNFNNYCSIIRALSDVRDVSFRRKEP